MQTASQIMAIPCPVGATYDKHHHDDPEMIVGIEGELEVSLTGEPPVSITAGKTILIPAGVEHEARVIGDTPAEILAVYLETVVPEPVAAGQMN